VIERMILKRIKKRVVDEESKGVLINNGPERAIIN
jgi:hypothetical protein